MGLLGNFVLKIDVHKKLCFMVPLPLFINGPGKTAITNRANATADKIVPVTTYSSVGGPLHL